MSCFQQIKDQAVQLRTAELLFPACVTPSNNFDEVPINFFSLIFSLLLQIKY
jgi:hypothetical protein